MGSLVVKLDRRTNQKLKNRWFYSDIDMISSSASNTGAVDELPMVYDVEAVKVAIRNILMWRVGESVISPEFGHNIHRSMYQQLDNFNKEGVAQEIQRAIEENEPRAQVMSVAIDTSSIEEDSDNSTLRVKVVYKVRGNKTEGTEFVAEATLEGK